MSESGLRPLTLSRCLVPSRKAYKPQKTYGDPSATFIANFVETLHRDTKVWGSQRRNVSRHMAPEDKKEYDIRQYLSQPNEGSSHPIVKAMKACRGGELKEMQHLLMPLQTILHVKQQLFYTVSEETSMNLGGFLQGVQRWEDLLCHDEIWSIIKQVLSGIKFLESRKLQHDQLALQNILLTWSGVVKIAAIDQIREERPEDWPKTIKAVKHLAESLIQVSRKPCIRCIDKACGIGDSKQCCDDASMLADADTLHRLLDNTRALTETSTSFQAIIQQTLSNAQSLPFIHQARGARLAFITKFAWKQIHHDATPVVKSISPITSLSRAICDGQSLKEERRLGQKGYDPERKKPHHRNLQWPKEYRRRKRRSNRIVWTDVKKVISVQ